MSEVMNYAILSEAARNAALTELIPADLRERGVRVIDAEAISGWAFSFVAWVGGGGFYEWAWASSYVRAVECACDKVIARIGEAQ